MKCLQMNSSSRNSQEFACSRFREKVPEGSLPLQLARGSLSRKGARTLRTSWVRGDRPAASPPRPVDPGPGSPGPAPAQAVQPRPRRRSAVTSPGPGGHGEESPRS